jgi:asparagine synthase (glutamine-hydrolysing)
MPGIVGLITKRPRQWAEEQLRKMVAVLRHEPSYVTGTWIEESLGVYVGWVARNNSFSSQMPLTNERGDRVLIFSGEEYPEPGATTRLRQRNHVIDDNPASYLVHVAEEDPAFPKSLNGRFQGLLVDRSSGIASLFNDRFGMHRVYYHEASDAFYFAVEAKAILAVRPELRRVDPQGLGEFVACGCVLEDRTIFSGLRTLPTASKWLFCKGTLQHKGNYFEASEWSGRTRIPSIQSPITRS